MKHTPASLASLFLNGAAERQLTRKQVGWLESVCHEQPATNREGIAGSHVRFIDGERMNQYAMRRWPNGTARLYVLPPPDASLQDMGA